MTDTPPPQAPLLSTIVAALLLAIVAQATSSCDPYNVGTATKRHTESTVQSLRAPWYGDSGLQVRDGLTVIEIHPQSMRQHGWPLPYKTLEQLVTGAVDASSRSLFIDLILTLPREKDAEFCSFARAVRTATGIEGDPWVSRVLDVKKDNTKMQSGDCLDTAIAINTNFIPIAPDARGPRLRNMMCAIAGGTPGDISGPCKPQTQTTPRLPILFGASLDYLNKQDAPPTFRHEAKLAILDRIAGLVPINVGAEQGRGYRLRVDELDFPSPALIMARDIECLGKLEAPECKVFAPLEKTDPGALPETIYLQWGASSAAKQNSVNESDGTQCNPQAADFSGKLGLWLNTFVARAIDGTNSGEKQRRKNQCPYHLTVSFDRFIPEPAGPIDRAATAEYFSDRHLMLGTDVDVLHDRVDVPVKGTIAAVHTHAMAYDNLLTFDSFYRIPSLSGVMQLALSFSGFAMYFFSAFGLMLLRDAKSAGKAFVTKIYTPRHYLTMAIMIAMSGYCLAQAWVITNSQNTLTEYFVVYLLILGVALLILSYLYRNTWLWGAKLHKALGELSPHLAIMFILLVFGIFIGYLLNLFLRWPPFNTFGTTLVTYGLYGFIFRTDIARARNQGGDAFVESID